MTNTINNHENVRNLGIILLAIGLMALTGRLLGEFDLGLFFLPTLAAAFLSAGIIWQTIGFIIPGGILAGISTGTLLNEFLPITGDAEGGIFMLSFAAGWVLVSLLGTVVEEGFVWWPLIPASVMALIGIGTLGAGWAFGVLSFSNMMWPIAVIGVGVYLLFKVRQEQ